MKCFMALLVFAFLIFSGCDDNSTESDTILPEVEINDLETEYTEGDIVVITAEASDNSGIEKVEFLINEELKKEDTEEPYEYEWDTAELNGSYTITAKAIDTSGNSASDEIDVDIIQAGPNNPPDAPQYPDPDNMAVNVSVNKDLSWTCIDPDGDDLVYDVYFGTNPIPDDGDLSSEEQSETFFDPSVLNPQTTYYWKIVAYDSEEQTESEIWSFTTGDDPVYGNMIFVEGGSFVMGNHYDDGNIDEKPLHTVTLNSFYIGQYEVTYTKFVEFLDSLEVSSNGSYDGYELIDMDDDDCAIVYETNNNLKFEFIGSESAPLASCPVIEVTWYGGVVFCNWLSEQEGLTPCYNLDDMSCDLTANGYRLPTEAEWEYAARGGVNWEDNYRYSGCNDEADLSDFAWYNDLEGITHEAGSKMPNQLGIYDMSGNVWEWCNDFYSDSYYKDSPEENPTGPVTGDNHVGRGGAWGDEASSCLVSNRGAYIPDFSVNYIGFRIARTAE